MKLRKPLRNVPLHLAVLAVVLVSLSGASCCLARPQESPPPSAQAGGEGRRMPLFGKISAIHDSSLEITDMNGATVTVKLSDKTEFRKDRQPAKRSDFKVGDVIAVRGDENPDHSWTAQVISARSMNAEGPGGRGGRGGPGGPGARGEGFGGPTGILGKDFVTGEVTAVDAPKLSILRSDKVTQTIELNEETSLRKGRESVTMADIQVGDHLFARGALENNVFVPKVVMVIGPEQWKRMQEMAGQPGGSRQPPATSGREAPAQKPPEPQP